MKKIMMLTSAAILLALTVGSAVAEERVTAPFRALGKLPDGLAAMSQGDLAAIEGGHQQICGSQLRLPVLSILRAIDQRQTARRAFVNNSVSQHF